MDLPTGVAVDSAGNVYVADTYNNRIQKFDSNGTFITKWGHSGMGDGEFNATAGVAVDSTGDVYVTDWWNHRIQKFGLATGLAYNIMQLTYKDYHDWNPKINNNGDIVWVGWIGPDYKDQEIFLYDSSTGTTTQLTNNSHQDFAQQINDSDDVVWMERRTPPRDSIYLYDGFVGTIIKLSDSIYSRAPDINAQGNVVWYGYDGEDFEIFFYDKITGTTIQLTSNDYDDAGPQINDHDAIVWYGGMYDHQREIFLYDASTGGPIQQLTENSYKDMDPKINNKGDVVWLEFQYSEWQILLYDKSDDTITQLGSTTGAYSCDRPQINENGDVVWTEFDGSDFEIFLYDSSTRTTTQLTNNDFNDRVSQINDRGDVVWVERMGPDMMDDEIFLFDSYTRTIIQLTNNDFYDSGPQINNRGDVVWSEFDGSDDEIFLAFLGENTPAGGNVVVTPLDQATGETPVTMTFQNVTESGATTLITSSDGPPPSEYFELGYPPTYYEITTTAKYSGTITICIDYSGISYENEDSLSLIHYTESGEEVVSIISHDKENDILCGQVDSLSFFTIVEPLSTEKIEILIRKVGDLTDDEKLNKGQGNALIAKLNAAIKNLNKGKKKTACNELQAFINQVEAFIKSKILTREEGQPLIKIAKEKIVKISG